MKPANGQVVSEEKLGNLEDFNGKPIKFEKQEDGSFLAKGSDNKTYSAALQTKSLIVNIFDTPQEKKEKKAVDERGKKLVQGEKVTGNLSDAKPDNRNKAPEPEKKFHR